MKKLYRIRDAAAQNDIKTLNDAIWSAGTPHRAEFLADLMCAHDALNMHHAVGQTESCIQNFCTIIKENNKLRGKVYCETNGIIMYDDRQSQMLPCTDVCFQEKLYHMICKYYFSLEVIDQDSAMKLYNTAIQHRAKSLLMESGFNAVCQKIMEDSEMVEFDTRNIQLIFKNYRRLKGIQNPKYQYVEHILKKALENNLVLFDGQFNKDYFHYVAEISKVIKSF